MSSRLFWNKERCYAEAQKYSSTKEWQQANESSYKSALNNGWLTYCREHMQILRKGLPPKYTLEQCIAIAESFSSRESWKKRHPSSYKCASAQGWYSACTKNLSKLKGLWNTLDKCKIEALKFNTKSEWRINSPSSYQYAQKKGWILECSSHMKHKTRENSIEKEILKNIKVSYPNAHSKRFIVKNPKFYAKIFELDIFVPELNLGIEFDGTYWHSFSALQRRFPTWPTQAVKEYHNLKDSFFLELGIKVLHIKEEDWSANKAEQLFKIEHFLKEL